MSSVIAKNYDAKLGQVLRQPELLRFIRSKIAQISPEMQNDPLVKDVNAQLGRDRADCGEAIRPGSLRG